MNRQQFSDFVKNPDLTNAQSLKMLDDLVKRYPYCQSGQILLTYNLFRENDLQYHAQLKKAAAYAGDRKKLKTLLSQPQHTVQVDEIALPAEEIIVPEADLVADPIEIPEVLAPEPAPPDVPEPEMDAVSVEVIAGPQPPEGLPFSGEQLSREDLLAIVKKRISEIESHGESIIEKVGGNISKNVLIEKFILEEPRISTPKATFFNPTDTSLRSNVDEEEIISETLARLYANQGNIQKAIHIYEKLSLLNQEKSRYFAAQIENLKS